MLSSHLCIQETLHLRDEEVALPALQILPYMSLGPSHEMPQFKFYKFSYP